MKIHCVTKNAPPPYCEDKFVN